MTAIARQRPQAWRSIAGFRRGTTATECTEQTDTDSGPETIAAGRHGHRAAQAEYNWVEAAATAGTRLPRG